MKIRHKQSRKLKYHFLEAGLPDSLKPMIGKRIEKAYLLPDDKCLFLILEEGHTILAEGMPPMGSDRAIEIETGQLHDNAQFDDIEHLAKNPYVRALVGKKFTGMDGDVLMFEEYGARFYFGGIHWVKIEGT